MQLKLEGIAKIRILMVCLGNICRSPLAEGVLKKMIRDHQMDHLIEVDSAGTARHTIGHPPDPRSKEVARLNGFELIHEGRQIFRKDFQRFDLILVMDESNLKDVLEIAKNDFERNKVKLITDFDPRPKKLQIVKDPYWGDFHDFVRTHEQLVHCCEGLLSFLKIK